MDPARARRRRRAALVAPIAAAIAVGVIGAWLGMSLLGATTVPIGPFRVELAAGFGRGQTRVGLPPFGSLTADTHFAPLGLSATLEDVGVERLTEIVRSKGVEGLVAAVERDARSQVAVLAWRSVLVAGLGAAVLAALVFRSRWRRIVVATATAIVMVAGGEALAIATFEPAEFGEPTYAGSLALAPDLIGPVTEATGRIDDLRAALEQIVDGTINAYTTMQATPLGEDAIRVLHISDIHSSPLGMDFAQQIARGFDVDLVIDTGDLTSFATPVENLIVTRIRGFARPYVFVRGSHDSPVLQASVALEPNAEVLDGRAKTIDGLTIYGLGHPAFTPARGTPVDGDEFAELARSVGDDIVADLEAIEQPVEVVAVHDDRMAEAVAGRVPVVVSGHFHESRATVVNGTLFLRVGTTGGSGAGIFRGLEDIPFGAEVLYFSREEEPRLIAYDVIEQEPESGSLTVRRVTVAEEFGELVLTPTPSPPTGPTGATEGTGTTATSTPSETSSP
jgi:predicted MPP superfamily phosphohydrolase